jgi:hypothetical protein
MVPSGEQSSHSSQWGREQRPATLLLDGNTAPRVCQPWLLTDKELLLFWWDEMGDLWGNDMGVHLVCAVWSYYAPAIDSIRVWQCSQ